MGVSFAKLVIAGLDPAIHLLKRMDARLKAGMTKG
jgi:hypothetical protein